MPSGRRYQQPKQPQPVFFLDRSIGRLQIAQVIRTRGYEALPMAEIYPGGVDQRIPDPEWILKADQENWVALTKDYSVVRDHSDVLAKTTLRLFSYNNANLTGPEMAKRLETNFSRILQKIAKPGPYIYVIARDKLEFRWPPSKTSS